MNNYTNNNYDKLNLKRKEMIQKIRNFKSLLNQINSKTKIIRSNINKPKYK